VAVFLFWIKIALKRLVELVRLSPVVVIGCGLFIGALVYTKTTIAIPLSPSRCGMALLLLFLISLVYALKKRDLLIPVTFYLKGGHTNRLIRVLFFSKRALLNNIPLLLFILCVKTGRIVLEAVPNTAELFLLFVFFLLCSVLTMALRHSAKSAPRKNKKRARRILNVVAKSAVQDFMSSDLVSSLILAAVLQAVVIVSLIQDPDMLETMEEPSFLFALLLGTVAAAFSGVINAASSVNWQFYSVMATKFSWHLKRLALFLIASTAVMVLPYSIITVRFGAEPLVIWLYAVVLFLVFSICMAFCYGNILKKSLLGGGFAAITLYLSVADPYLVCIMTAPLVVLFLKVKNEFTDWTYL
jgi:hypothetical protein